ncbi:MAG: SDR family NAD(P)-dependent oxidoreductase [Maritimibacter sp.]|nr:SDR family NAD(P)-dependent oxidoreductase [Maritimibacter sp.]
MPELAGRRYWLVGASEGLGLALARALDAEGASLVLSARNAAKLDALASSLRDARALPMDVTDPQSVSNAAGNAREMDGVVYIAGAYEPMTAAAWGPEEAARMAEVNFVGALRVLGHMVPGFAARGTGHVVLIGSLSGFAGLPGAIGYGASKAGLMHLAENIRVDLRGTGVVVQRVNPGFIRTRLTSKNDFAMPQILSPETAAARVVAAMKSGRFSTSFPAPFAWLFTCGRHLPVAWFQRIFA